MKKNKSILDEWERMTNGYKNKKKPYVKIFITQLKKENPSIYKFIIETNYKMSPKFAKTLEGAEKHAKKFMLKHVI